MLAQSAGHSSGHTAKATGQANAAQHIVSAHPYVQAANNAISQHAAQHVLNIVQQSMAQHHAAAHAAAHHAAHIPVIHLPHLGPAHPHDPTAQFLASLLANKNQPNPMGPAVMGADGQWHPAPQQPGQMVQPSAPQGYGYDGNPYGTSIDSGNSGFMGYLHQALGL